MSLWLIVVVSWLYWLVCTHWQTGSEPKSPECWFVMFCPLPDVKTPPSDNSFIYFDHRGRRNISFPEMEYSYVSGGDSFDPVKSTSVIREEWGVIKRQLRLSLHKSWVVFSASNLNCVIQVFCRVASRGLHHTNPQPLWAMQHNQLDFPFCGAESCWKAVGGR